MRFELTKRQVARGARPDAEQNGKIYLIKNTAELRATYQIRLLLYRAVSEGKKLVLDIPKECKLHVGLRELVREHRRHIEIART
jgi:hypothetical protein